MNETDERFLTESTQSEIQTVSITNVDDGKFITILSFIEMFDTSILLSILFISQNIVFNSSMRNDTHCNSGDEYLDVVQLISPEVQFTQMSIFFSESTIQSNNSLQSSMPVRLNTNGIIFLHQKYGILYFCPIYCITTVIIQYLF